MINEEAVRIAREASGERAFVAGAVGPLRREAFGEHFSSGEIREVYAEQVAALERGGADVIILETFSNLEHLKIALAAAKKQTRLPVIAQMVFMKGNRTGFSDSMRTVVDTLEAGGADVIGVNCGCGPVAMLDIARTLTRMTDSYVSAQPNAGYPQLIDGRPSYPTSAEYFAAYAHALKDAGVNIVGGCCGTTPEHIRAAARALGDRKPAARARVVSVAALVEAAPVPEASAPVRFRTSIIAELLPPRNVDMSGVIESARSVVSAGAGMLSFPDNPLGRVRMHAAVAAGLVQRAVGVEAMFHYACRDTNLIGLQSGLLGAHALGLHWVLAVTGDPASSAHVPGASSVFDLHSVKLVELIANMRSSLGLDMRIAVAFNPNFDDLSGQCERLKRKIDAGAELVVTQPVFDADKAARIRDAVTGRGVRLFLGVLPLLSRKSADYFNNEVPGMSIPARVLERLAGADPERVKAEGEIMASEFMQSAAPFCDGYYLISPGHCYDVTARIIASWRAFCCRETRTEGAGD